MAEERDASLADGFEAHWLEQVRLGLRLTPAQRLAWLEDTVTELSGWVGRARGAHRIVKADAADNPTDR
jgi:hypothetical protein